MAVAASVGALSFGPVVRARVAREAARRHLEVRVGAVRPGWFAVRLVDVSVRAEGVSAVTSTFDEVRVDLARDLHVRSVAVHGGRVDVVGDAASLRAQIEALRALGPSESDATGPRTPLRGDGIALHWEAANEGAIAVEASGAGFTRDDQGTRLFADFARVARGADIVAEASFAALALGRGGVPKGGSVKALTLTWAPTPSTAERAGAEDAGDATALPTMTLHTLRAHADRAAAMLASKLPAATRWTVDAFTVRAKRGGSDLTLGPGPLSIAREEDRVTIDVATRAPSARTEGAPFAVHAVFPLTPTDVTLSLEGGPVPLALLGLSDGTAGLTDLDEGTMSGNTLFTVGPASDALRFDGDVQLHGISIFNRRLAKDIVRGLDLGVRARGKLSGQDELHLEESELSMGKIRFDARGDVSVRHAAAETTAYASLDWAMPSAPCEEMFESLPRALIPSAFGTTWDGSFDASGKVVFDSRHVDDLILDYAIHDGCKVASVPEPLARDHFAHAFTHRIYSPDGEATEETTGPGTSGWTPIASICRNMQVAVLMTEDGGVYRKDGFNHPQIKLAFVTDLKERRFARGASTMIMQLAKNLFQGREKTAARKLEQVILTEYIAQTFTEREVLELYLNVIEFGPNVYGIRAAAAHYFGKGPYGLSLAESLFLAALLPSPVKLHAMKYSGVSEGLMQSIYHLMEIAKVSGLIDESQLEEGKRETLSFAGGWSAPKKGTDGEGASSTMHGEHVHEGARLD